MCAVLASLTFPKDNAAQTAQVLQQLASKVGVVRPGQAVIEGVHAEGPIVASLGKRI